jgi:hypothetical protein
MSIGFLPATSAYLSHISQNGTFAFMLVRQVVLTLAFKAFARSKAI